MDPQVILQPTANKDARRHYRDTIEQPVALSRIKEIAPAVASSLSAEVQEQAVAVWGVTPGKGGVNVGKWDRIAKGAVALFAQDKKVIASGIVISKVRNEALAAALWGRQSDGATWEYVYFLDKIRSQDVPVPTLNTAAGYEPGANVQGFNVLAPSKSAAIISGLGLAIEYPDLPDTAPHLPLATASGRMAVRDFDPVGPEHVYDAVARLRAGTVEHGFAPSREFDLVLEDGVRLAPKAVFGVAAEAALGRPIGPKDFTGVEGSMCFHRLRGWGYRVEPKEGWAPGDDASATLSEEDRAWAEGRPKLTRHLTRERKPGLAAAKKAAFLREHGKLFCENCKVDPASAYGEEDGAACIEVHHVNPLSGVKEDHQSTIHDVVCLCANCHRVEHKRLRRKAKALKGTQANSAEERV